MARQITASPELLYGDGRYVAKEALTQAKEDIDQLFGDGFAQKNPALLAAMLSAAVAAGSKGNDQAILQEGFERISVSISELASNVMYAGEN